MQVKCPSKTKQVEEVNHVLAGRMIRKLREKQNISLRTFAKKFGKTAPYVSDLERGRRNWNSEIFDKAMNILTNWA